jgi:hypothetical protein
MESQPSSQQLGSHKSQLTQLTQQPATQQLQQVPEKTKTCFKRKNNTIGCHSGKNIKVKKILAASAVIVPSAPNSVLPPAAVHPL